jgi:putative FmdB family regulatory protein
MPIFEYQCKVCGSVSEFLLGVGHEQQITCEKCGSLEMEKILSTPFFLSSTAKNSRDHTCCGREERCETPPCSKQGGCYRD